MKKLSVLLLICILTACTALAETGGANQAPVGEIIELTSGMSIDLDGDMTEEAIEYSVAFDDQTGASSYRLVIGTNQLDGEGENMTGRIHAYRPEGVADTLLFLSEYGPSDDDASYVYSYYQGQISYLGTIGCMPWNLEVTDHNVLTGTARGSILHTWFRPADYVIATAYVEPDYVLRSTAICEMPRSEYPMGTLVTLKRDLGLQVSRDNYELACELKAGDRAVIVSTDDIEWLYIVPLNPSYDYQRTSGWLRTQIGGYSCSINGEIISTYDLFDGLFYAD